TCAFIRDDSELFLLRVMARDRPAAVQAVREFRKRDPIHGKEGVLDNGSCHGRDAGRFHGRSWRFVFLNREILFSNNYYPFISGRRGPCLSPCAAPARSDNAGITCLGALSQCGGGRSGGGEGRNAVVRGSVYI